MRTLLIIMAVIAVSAIAALAWIGRQERLGKRKHKDLPKDGGGVQDMRACPHCGAYILATQSESCGKPDCPIGLSRLPRQS